jgi:L-serine dehydratase
MGKFEGMFSLRELYRIGKGPSASHTMGPHAAAKRFRDRTPQAAAYRVTLHGSLAATGRGHLTDVAICEALSESDTSIVWAPDDPLPLHPNGMTFEALDQVGAVLTVWRGYSPGGGAIWEESGPSSQERSTYQIDTMAAILEWCADHELPMWSLVEECEGVEIWDFLEYVWDHMLSACNRGLAAEGVLPGGLKLPRKAAQCMAGPYTTSRRSRLLSAYALAVAEESAAVGIVSSAPTCGSCGVLPSVLRYVSEERGFERRRVLEALAVAGLIGNLVKTNASISGAEVGCQGEVGTACSMAAGAAAYLLGATPQQIEYAAEMGLEHHLGMTCDPILGLVQIPCIERNAMAAMRALDCAEYALLGDGKHIVSFDSVVATMKQTGHDLPSIYRETARGGLAHFVRIDTDQ